MKLLEIFCGTKSIGKVFEKNGWEVYSVDLEERFEPTECVDILDFDYKKLCRKISRLGIIDIKEEETINIYLHQKYIKKN